MADHAPSQQIELVPVKAEDIIAERTRFWDRFMQATTWTIGAVVLVLVLMLVFLV